jgi:hypothetical protein
VSIKWKKQIYAHIEGTCSNLFVHEEFLLIVGIEFHASQEEEICCKSCDGVRVS